MSLKHILAVFAAFALSLAAFACSSGDDDDAGGADVAQPTETEETPDDSEGEDDSGGDDSGSGNDTSSRGDGTVVIAEETFEFPAEWCTIDADGSVIIAGPSTTASGEPVYVQIEYFGGDVDPVPSVQLSVGATSLFSLDGGSPDYHGSAEGDFVADVNGGAHIAFTASNFFDRASNSNDRFEGSVDASCE